MCSVSVGLAQKAASAEAKTAGDPLEVLGRWVGGTWHGEGKTVDSPYSKAGEFNGTTTCAWSPNHAFLVCDQTFSMDGKNGRDLSLYTYDATAKTYRFWGVSPEGEPVRRPQLTISGNTWTYENEVPIGEHKVRFRTTNTWESDDRVAFKTEYSVDGADFKAMNSGMNTRAK